MLAAAKNLDTDLGPGELYRLAQAVTDDRPGEAEGLRRAGPHRYAGAASVVFPDVAQARRIGNDARSDGTLDHGC